MRRWLAALGIVLAAAALRPLAFAFPGSPVAVGGLLELWRWPLDSTNLLKNPSFEEVDGRGQPVGWAVGESAHFSAVTGVSRSGVRSMRLKDSHLAAFYPNATQVLPLEAGWYSMRGWMRAEGAGANDPNAGGRIAVRWGKETASTDLIRGTTGWTPVGVGSFPILAGDSASIQLEAYRKPSGTLYFDDLEVRRQVAPGVEGFLLYPNYRGLLFDDRPQALRMSVTLRPEQAQARLSDLTVRLSLSLEATGAPAASVEANPSTPSFLMTLDAGGLGAGAYTLRLQTVRRGTGALLFEYPPYRIVKLSAATRKSLNVFVDHDGVLVAGGRREFVLGIYDTSGYAETPDFYEPRISQIARAPFNLYLNYWLGRAPQPALSALTSALRKHGMSYLHTVNFWYEEDEQWPLLPPCGGGTSMSLRQEGYTGCRAKEMGADGGLAGWYTADERGVSQAARVFGQYKALRQNDPGGVTFIAQNNVRELSRWRDATDVMGVDPYPIFNIPEGSPSPLEMVTDWVEAAQRAVEASRPVWAVIQFFPFGYKGHWPTYDELRTMSYMAVVAGAKGLFYWSYGAQGLSYVDDPREREELWQRLIRVTKEIKSLEPALLGPDAPEILSGHSPPGTIRVLPKRSGEARYLFAVNNTPRQVEATFTLTQPAGAIEVVGEGRSASRGGSSGYGDLFAPYAVHVYRIEQPR